MVKKNGVLIGECSKTNESADTISIDWPAQGATEGRRPAASGSNGILREESNKKDQAHVPPELLPMDGPPPSGPPTKTNTGVSAFHGHDEPKEASARGSPRDSSIQRSTGSSQRFVLADAHDSSLMVTSFACQDSTAVPSLGKSCKSATIRVQVGPDARPVEIRLVVDSGVWGTPDVRICSGYECLFPKRGAHGARAKLKRDFAFRWPFRGQVEGLREPGIYEVWRSRWGQKPQWMPCTVMHRREDGTYQVFVPMTDSAGNSCDVEFHDVSECDIRLQLTKAPLFVPDRSLELVVPREDPLQATLGFGGESEANFFGHYFAHVNSTQGFFENGVLQLDSESCRLQALGTPRTEVLLRIAKNREWVHATVGHTALTRFVDNVPAAVSAEVDRRSRSWVVQLGPYVEHHIRLERKTFDSRIFCLTIDGESFVEATAHDLRCNAGVWECSFRFVGKACLNFEVYETTVDGNPLERKTMVEESLKYVHECSVAIQDESHLESAELLIDGVPFGDLPLAEEYPLLESNLSMTLPAFEEEFRLKVPKKVNVNVQHRDGNGADDALMMHAKGHSCMAHPQLPVINALLGFSCCVDAEMNSTAELVVANHP